MSEARSKKHIFAFFTSTILRTAYRKQFTVLSQTNGTDGKPETLKVCLLPLWRVCDQAFGKYRPMKGAEK